MSNMEDEEGRRNVHVGLLLLLIQLAEERVGGHEGSHGCPRQLLGVRYGGGGREDLWWWVRDRGPSVGRPTHGLWVDGPCGLGWRSMQAEAGECTYLVVEAGGRVVDPLRRRHGRRGECVYATVCVGV